MTRCPLRISCPVTPVERDVVGKRVDLGSVDVLERSDLQDRKQQEQCEYHRTSVSGCDDGTTWLTFWFGRAVFRANAPISS
jgi:hypothetical protein